jgi:hypothetical protein
MAKYRVVGARTVDGVAPGGTVTIADASPLDVEALVTAGNLEPVVEKAKTAPKDGDK